MRLLVNQFNYLHSVGNDDDPGKGRFERFTKPSLTEPGQAVSLKEMVARYVRGQDVKVFNTHHVEDDDFADLQGMDYQNRLSVMRRMEEQANEAARSIRHRHHHREKELFERTDTPDPEAAVM